MTSEQSLISIVLIFYNAPVNRLEAAIKSVFAQSYGVWELLLIDDGSTNDSSQLAHNYALLYPHHVRYLDHQRHLNLGVSASYNLGIEQAKGDYIAFFSANQTWLSNKLSAQLATLEQFPQVAGVWGFLEHSTIDLQLSHKKHRHYWNQHFSLGFDQVHQPPHLGILLLLNRTRPFSVSNILFRRKALLRTGIFDLKLNTAYALDALMLRLSFNLPIYIHRQSLVVYPNSLPDSEDNESSRECDRYPNSTSLARRVYQFWLENYLISQISPVNQLTGKRCPPRVVSRELNSEVDLDLGATCQLIHRQLFPQRYSWLIKAILTCKKSISS